MEKPQEKIIKYFDYREVKEYLQREKGISFGEFNAKNDDFWNWLIDTKDASNGTPFVLWVEDDFDEAKEWLGKVITAIFQEFGNGDAEITLMASW